MELDKRIIKGKRPLTALDTDVAKEFIGKQCYFTSKFENFENLSKVPHATLHNIDDSHVPFQCYGDDGILCYDCFILPCEWVEEKKEPKYRPYTMKEFLREYSIGESILKIRDKREPEYVYQYLFIGHSKNYVGLGGWMFAFTELFDHFEIGEGVGDEETWQPFGVLEE